MTSNLEGTLRSANLAAPLSPSVRDSPSDRDVRYTQAKPEPTHRHWRGEFLVSLCGLGINLCCSPRISSQGDFCTFSQGLKLHTDWWVSLVYDLDRLCLCYIM